MKRLSRHPSEPHPTESFGRRRDFTYNGLMTKIEAIEKEIEQLSEEDLSLFRRWFAEFDFALWDRQIERDSRAGKLDALIDQARRDHAAGKTKKL